MHIGTKRNITAVQSHGILSLEKKPRLYNTTVILPQQFIEKSWQENEGDCVN